LLCLLVQTRLSLRRRLEDKPSSPAAKTGGSTAVAPASKAPAPDPDEEDVQAVTTGSQRRAIKNFKELAATLKETFPPLPGSAGPRVSVAYLENLSIHAQFRLFRSAKVIIAQHGAGLSNIFFIRNATGIIEISPYTTENRVGKYTTAYPNCFEYLAKSIGVAYTRIQQNGEFSPVDIPTVVEVARHYLSES
jgi:hypothetical protein